MTQTVPAPRRAALYALVSTVRQAEGELSIPDQVRQGEQFCAARGMDLIATFIEPGASATDDRRPEFQRMIDAATGPARPFDAIVVHSMSRFFREQFLSEFYIRKLRRAGVALLSITQDFRDDPTGNLIRQVLGSFDEYQSRENGKHTLRAMQENARQGFWNGSQPPFGYQAVAAERRGSKVKKRLVLCEAEAEVVRRIFRLALGQEGLPLGVKAIASRLNAEGQRYRGKPFHISAVHRLLTATTYAGVHHFNRREARSGRPKGAEQWIAMPVPPIIAREQFRQVQAVLAARNRRCLPPRVVGSPVLLTGIARCATCGAGMTLRTGKSGRYRYYACAGAAQKGHTICPGRSIAMAALDGMVLEHLADRLFTPERLEIVLAAYVARSAAADQERRERLAQARRSLTEAEGRLARLLELVERGRLALDDPVLRERMDAARLARQAAADQVQLLAAPASAGAPKITPDKLRQFAVAARQALTHGDPAFRKAYVRLFLAKVIVGDTKIRLSGPTDALARAARTDDPSATPNSAQPCLSVPRDG